MTGGKGESDSGISGAAQSGNGATAISGNPVNHSVTHGATAMSGNAVNHSVIVDPSFVLLNKIKHAKGCEREICFSADCGVTKFLLKHINGCKHQSCNYQNCELGKVLLDHDSNRHRNLEECPICKKHRALMRVHPGKAPRSMDVEKELDDVNGASQRSALMNISNVSRTFKRPAASRSSQSSRASSPLMHEKRMREDAEETVQAPSISKFAQTMIAQRLQPIDRRIFMAQYEHTRKCNEASCPSKDCNDHKVLLEHVKGCRDRECGYNKCRMAVALLLHYNKCEPEGKQCHFCFKNPPYRGKDYFADLNTAVLRNIALHLEKDAKSLNALQQVNKRVYSFFNFSGEIKGLFQKIKFDILYVSHVGNGTICARFMNKSNTSDGYFVLLTKDGASERIRYSGNKKQDVDNYVRNKYAPTGLGIAPLPPANLTQDFYNSLAHALQKYDFEFLFLNSVIINFDKLNNFFIEQRNGNEYLLNGVSIKFKNVKFTSRD